MDPTQSILSELFLRALFRVLPMIPPRFEGALARATSGFEYRISRGRRAAVSANLAQIAHAGHPRLHDPVVRRRVARKVFESHHRGLIEYLAQRSTDAREISETFRFRGAERLYHALAADRGAVVAAAHTGSWELAGLALARLGFRLHVVTGTQFHPLLSAGARRIKEARNIRVSTPADGFAPLLRTLREGGLVVLLVDGDVFQRSVPAPFFGRPTPFPVGPAILARRARAPLLHAHAERDGQGRHVIVFDGQDESDSALGVEEDLHRMTRGVARALESAVATRVEQWCIFRRMWGEEDAA